MSDQGLAERLAALVATMRRESRESLELFLDSAEARMGGTVIIQAPSTWRKRSLPEAGFRTEQFHDLQ